MNAAVTVLAWFSALAYAGMTAFALSKRWTPRTGHGLLNICALAAFALERLVPGDEAAAAMVCALLAAALLQIARRSSPASAGVMAGIPLCTMLLVVDRPFFPAQTQAQFQIATLALLCAAGPLGLISLLLERSAFPRKSFP